MKRSVLNLLCFSLIVLVGSCNKGSKNPNQAPNTQVVPHIINLQGDIRLRSTVKLAWFGTDVDGYIKGYEYSLDNINWIYTTKSDSTFVFDIQEGSDTADIDFWVRAIDNFDIKDPSPAYLKVPVKNSPPEVQFDQVLSTSDTAFIVSTIFWEASDLDGLDNLKSVEIKLNNGSWYPLDKSVTNVTLVPINNQQTGVQDARVYLGSDEELSQRIDGLIVGDTNQIFIRAFDIANSESEWDTITGLFIKPKSANLLVLGGDGSENSFYTGHISSVHPQFDYIDLTVDNGKWQPAFWDPTFTLLLQQYEKACFVTDRNPYLNGATNKTELLLESAARSIQDYYNSGGKIMTVAYFPYDLDSNSLLFGVLPMDPSTRFNSAVFTKAGPTVTGQLDYPNLEPTTFSNAISPFVPASDAQAILIGDLDMPTGWNGPSELGARRQVGGKTHQVLVAAGLNDMNGNPAQIDSLFNYVLNQEFNW